MDSTAEAAQTTPSQAKGMSASVIRHERVTPTLQSALPTTSLSHPLTGQSLVAIGFLLIL